MGDDSKANFHKIFGIPSSRKSRKASDLLHQGDIELVSEIGRPEYPLRKNIIRNWRTRISLGYSIERLLGSAFGTIIPCGIVYCFCLVIVNLFSCLFLLYSSL